MARTAGPAACVGRELTIKGRGKKKKKRSCSVLVCFLLLVLLVLPLLPLAELELQPCIEIGRLGSPNAANRLAAWKPWPEARRGITEQEPKSAPYHAKQIKSLQYMYLHNKQATGSAAVAAEAAKVAGRGSERSQ